MRLLIKVVVLSTLIQVLVNQCWETSTNKKPQSYQSTGHQHTKKGSRQQNHLYWRTETGARVLEAMDSYLEQLYQTCLESLRILKATQQGISGIQKSWSNGQ